MDASTAALFLHRRCYFALLFEPLWFAPLLCEVPLVFALLGLLELFEPDVPVELPELLPGEPLPFEELFEPDLLYGSVEVPVPLEFELPLFW